jgi:hypothetical protein
VIIRIFLISPGAVLRLPAAGRDLLTRTGTVRSVVYYKRIESAVPDRQTVLAHPAGVPAVPTHGGGAGLLVA